MDNIQITKDCVHSVSNIGSTTFQNICNGTSDVVIWGALDWLGFIAVVGMAVVISTYLYRATRD